jgi:hypothetical protein
MLNLLKKNGYINVVKKCIQFEVITDFCDISHDTLPAPQKV